ncbi:unnamed protein product [Vitrella brassicaformis CCMP3155]|uniref:AAA+ ATPase domain-containing protein n=1 Tax=Vitrella brassicaformis (strain CCMP3155) TaxID=1169540 RepID=A0A0G4FKM4_VITBC|nr:unnamed protein product [Vitrella brassicaformis CCMP3155]|eukprot:CEM14539.1 unnamed protein product [Vitrella brassicaformis CCMP3155]
MPVPRASSSSEPGSPSRESLASDGPGNEALSPSSAGNQNEGDTGGPPKKGPIGRLIRRLLTFYLTLLLSVQRAFMQLNEQVSSLILRVFPFLSRFKLAGRPYVGAFARSLAMFGVLMLVRRRWVGKGGRLADAGFSYFLRLLQSGKLEEVVIREDSVLYLSEGRAFRSPIIPTYVTGWLLSTLTMKNVPFQFKPHSAVKDLLTMILVSWAPVLLLLAYMKNMLGKDEDVGNEADTSRLGQISFADVAGMDRSKREVQEIVEMLRTPQQYTTMGARLPRGVLLVGPPGTGKTMLARALAAEAGVPFLYASGSDFVEVFVGRGASRVRELFRKAKDDAPCIIFIDEIDTLGKRRPGETDWGLDGRESVNQEYTQTLNALLACMDGLDRDDSESPKPIVVIGATNRYGVLDEALTRPGRFDRIVRLDLPDNDGRLAILKVYARRLVLNARVDLRRIAELTKGLSGAELEAIVNEAAIRAVRKKKKQVGQMEFEEAVLSVISRKGGLSLSAAVGMRSGLEQLTKFLSPKQQQQPGSLPASDKPSHSPSSSTELTSPPTTFPPSSSTEEKMPPRAAGSLL